MRKVALTISVYVSTRDWLKRQEHERDINISRYVERLILQDKKAQEVENEQ